MFSSDAFGLPELYVAGAAQFRETLGTTLDAWIADDRCSADDAERIALMIGRENALRIYPVLTNGTRAMGLFERDAKAIADIERLRFFPLAVVGGEGSYLIAEDGRRLLDLSATWGAAGLGYGHPAVVEAVTAATRSMAGAGVLSLVTEPAVGLAEDLLRIVPGDADRRVWFGHSGSDANEAAVRAIMAATGRERILSFVGAYHGGTAGSMAISGHSAQEGVDKLSGLELLPIPIRTARRRPATRERRSSRVWTRCSRPRAHPRRSRRSSWSRSSPTGG